MDRRIGGRSMRSADEELPHSTDTRVRDGSGARRSRRPPLALLGAVLAAAFAGAPMLAMRRVRRMRRAARSAPALVLDVDLDGTAPERLIVLLGDSASAGFRLATPEQSAGRRIARALNLRDGRATRLRSVARNGATTADVLAEQLNAAAGADVVMIGVGANDASHRVPSASLEADLEELLTRVREVAAPHARVVLVGCPDLSVAPGLPILARAFMRFHVRRVVRVQGRVAAALAVPVVGLPRRDLTPDVFGEDGFHPGPLGHERISSRILTVL